MTTSTNQKIKISFSNEGVQKIFNSFEHKSAGMSEYTDLIHIDQDGEGKLSLTYPDMKVNFASPEHCIAFLLSIAHRTLNKMSQEDRTKTGIHCSTGPWLALKHGPAKLEPITRDLISEFNLKGIADNFIHFKNTIICKPAEGISLTSLKDTLLEKGFSFTGVYLDEETLQVEGLKVKLPETDK